MTESSGFDDSLSAAERAGRAVPDGVSLPAVEPPSAGFIIQLFVVPALIVAVVIGVYLLFGRLAATHVDWRERVVDLRSSNQHTRWRGAYGLAQLLEADAAQRRAAQAAAATTDRPDADAARPLAGDPDLAAELAATLAEELQRPEGDDEHRQLLEYLVKSVGWMDVPEATLPTLRAAASATRSPWLRQQALVALGMSLGRAQQRGAAVHDDALAEELIAITAQETALLRHLATYALGFVGGARAQERLAELIHDADAPTRANAASGLARTGSPIALAYFTEVLTTARSASFDPHAVSGSGAAEAYFERAQILTNALVFVAKSAPRLAASERADLRSLLTPLTEVADAKLRHLAIEAQLALDAADARP